MAKSDGCKQGCCRVPFEGLCARQKQCGCHSQDQPIRKRLTLEELLRAHAVSEQKGTRK